MIDSAVCLYSRMTTDTYQHSLCSYELDWGELTWIELNWIELNWNRIGLGLCVVCFVGRFRAI